MKLGKIVKGAVLLYIANEEQLRPITKSVLRKLGLKKKKVDPEL